MSLVLDSSAALAWIYAEETTDAVRQIFESVAENGAHVPALWRLEVANSLTVAVRRGRIDVAFRNAFRLTLYDAAYLELAYRRSLPLASLDDELRAAGRALGVPLLGAAA